jgi:hypothetical protein
LTKPVDKNAKIATLINVSQLELTFVEERQQLLAALNVEPYGLVMNPFASLQFANRKAVIATAIAVMVVFVLYNKSNNYQIVSNSVAESVCSLGKKFHLNFIHLKNSNCPNIFQCRGHQLAIDTSK